MEFDEFARRAAAIEDETADLAIVDRVTDLLRAADDDLPTVARFVQGRVFPAWESTTLDIGPNYCYEAIARAAGQNVSADDVEDRLADRGEIGDVAASYDFGGQQGLGAFGGGGRDGLTVGEVADELETLAARTGDGSQDAKIDSLFGLFNRCDPAEARYVARIVLSEMRIGVGEGTVRDAIGAAFDVPVESVERALQVSNDYGRVAVVARDDGVEGLDEMSLQVGRPVQSMLAQTGTVSGALEDWDEAAVEWKFDGARCVGGNTPVYTKSKGALSIRYVSKGDEVLTHEGRYRRVVGKSERTMEKDEILYELSTWLGIPFQITGDHEVRVLREGGWKWEPVENLSADDVVMFPVPHLSEGTPKDSITVSTHANYTKEIPVTERLYRLLGYWVGDGSASSENSNNHRVRLSFDNQRERELLKEYRSLINELFDVGDILSEYNHEEQNSITLHWQDAALRQWLNAHFRTNDPERRKTVPDWMAAATKTQFEAFLEGWHEADGTGDDDEQQYITTRSRTLASRSQLIGFTHGTPLGISRIRKDDQTYYRVGLTKKTSLAEIENGQAKVKIRKLREVKTSNPGRELYPPRKTLYDLQVEGDESYCVPIMAVHNCQLHADPDGETSVFSRNMEDVTDALPEVVEFAEEHVDSPVILDGEVVAVDVEGDPLPFQEVLRRFRRKHDVAAAREEVEVRPVFFDCLHADGSDLLDASLTERYERLEAVLDDGEGLSKLWTTDDPDEIADVEADSLETGHEGIMLKNPDSEYSPGRRGRNWRKRKPDVETLDLVVTGAEWGEGRRANVLGTFLLSARTEEGYETIGKVATGITDEELDELTELLEPHVRSEDGQDVDLEPTVVFEVGYEEIQESPTYSSGYALRFPRFLAVRDDVDPADADSLERVERLAEQQ